MIDKLKDMRYKSDEQIKLYENEKIKLSNHEKIKLAKELIKEDLFMFLNLISKITLEVAEVSNEYLKLLEIFSEKIKNDMAQKPFLDTLVDIGKSREDIALDLYHKIFSETKKDYLKIISGLILGGYSINHEEEFKDMIKGENEVERLISYLKVILVIYNEEEIPQEVYDFLEKISKRSEENLLREFANLSLFLYSKNPSFFYSKILELVKLKNKEINYLIFSRLSYMKILGKEERFELIDIGKDSDPPIIDEILQILKNYPEEPERIGNLIIYFIERDLKFKLRNIDWVLGELSKANEKIGDFFIENFKKMEKKDYMFHIPNIFLITSKENIKHSIDLLSKLGLSKKNELRLFYALTRKIISNIYGDENNFDSLVKLTSLIQDSAKSRKFISQDLFKKVDCKPSGEKLKIEYEKLINGISELLDQLENRQDEYNFDNIEKNIEKYPKVYQFGKDVIFKCKKDGKFSPLLWLGERETPRKDKIKIKDGDDDMTKYWKISFIRDSYWPRAYLNEMEESLKKYEKFPNGKFKKKHLIKGIKNNFLNGKRFWTYFSELVFMNKFEEENILELEPSVPNRSDKNLDLKVRLFKRDIFFEITSPERDRSLKLSSGAVSLGNKSFSSIDRKFRQMFSKDTLKEMNDGKRKDLFFVVLDVSSSTIDEYDILNSFGGSLSLTMQIDKTTGKVINESPSRQKDSLYDKNTNTEIITGVIYFKKELGFKGENPRIKLKGDIVLNPNAKNTLSKQEREELKKIIFF